MIGGALPRFKVLVDHLASKTKSIHPVMELFKADTETLLALSDFGFSHLRLIYSNFWLVDLFELRPSSN